MRGAAIPAGAGGVERHASARSGRLARPRVRL